MADLKTYNFCYNLAGSQKHPLILFLHGFMGNGGDWTEIISELSENFCCLTVDLPGHGNTRVLGGEECYTMPNTARALIDLLDFLRIDKCFSVGYSMGGRLALYMTLEFPDRFEKTILESASPGLKAQEERSRRLHSDWQLARELETGDFNQFLFNWYKQPLFDSLRNLPNFDKIIETRLKNNPLELAKSLRYLGTGNQPSLWDKLSQNNVPLLLLVGEHDNKFRTINAEMEAICQVAELEIIPESGHNIHLENFSQYLASLRNFFRDQSPLPL